MTMMAAPIARLLAALWLLSQPSLASIRSDFIHAMQQVEREHQMEQADRRLQQRLWDVARPLRRRLDEDQDSYVSVEDYDQSLDLTNYAFKYVGCQSIHTWSDDLAEDESSTTVLGLQKFVIFRLCELDSCSDYNRFGCMYNYGEYLVDMSDYLEIMHDNHRTMMSTYCSVCAKCLTMDSHIAYYQNAASSNAATDDASKSDDATDDAVAYGDDWAGGAQADDWSGYNKYWGDGGNRKRRTQYNYYGSSMYNYGNGGSSSYASSNSINRGGNSWFNWWSNSNNFKGGQSYYNNYTNYTNNDDAQANDDAAQQEQRVWYSDEDGKCIFEEVCNGYNSACKNFDSTATNSENYLACTEFDVGNNVGGYLGPHCRSDGVSIGIGMFEDENCNVYVSDVMDSGYTAQSFGSDDLAPYYDTSCVSCKASEGTALITDDAIAQQEYTYPFCSAIYYQAAKCNRYFRGDSYSDDQENQEKNEQVVCDMIGALVLNKYDEFGELYFPPDFDMAHSWNHPAQYHVLLERASPGQVFGMVFSISLCASLLAYACYLQKKLFYRMPWNPPKHVTNPSSAYMFSDEQSINARAEAGRLSRINSGIIAMRSRSVDRSSVASPFHGGVDDNLSILTPSNGAFA